MLNIIISDDFPLGWLKIVNSIIPRLQLTHAQEDNNNVELNFSISKNQHLIVFEVANAVSLLKDHRKIYNILSKIDIYTQHICMFCAKPGYLQNISTFNFISCESCFDVMLDLQKTANNLSFDMDFETIKNMNIPIINYIIPEYYDLLIPPPIYLHSHINMFIPQSLQTLNKYQDEEYLLDQEQELADNFQHIIELGMLDGIRENIGENIKPFMYIQSHYHLRLYLESISIHITEKDMDVHLNLIKHNHLIYPQIEKIYLDILSRKDFNENKIKKI